MGWGDAVTDYNRPSQLSKRWSGAVDRGPPTSRPQQEAGGPCPTIEVWRSRAVNGTARLQDDERVSRATPAGNQKQLQPKHST